MMTIEDEKKENLYRSKAFRLDKKKIFFLYQYYLLEEELILDYYNDSLDGPK